jgi:hypothetical protein
MFLAFLMLFRAEGGYSTPVSVTMLVLLGYCFPLLAMNDVGSDTRSWLPPSVLMHVMVVRTLDNVTLIDSPRQLQFNRHACKGWQDQLQTGWMGITWVGSLEFCEILVGCFRVFLRLLAPGQHSFQHGIRVVAYTVSNVVEPQSSSLV